MQTTDGDDDSDDTPDHQPTTSANALICMSNGGQRKLSVTRQK